MRQVLNIKDVGCSENIAVHPYSCTEAHNIRCKGRRARVHSVFTHMDI